MLIRSNVPSVELPKLNTRQLLTVLEVHLNTKLGAFCQQYILRKRVGKCDGFTKFLIFKGFQVIEYGQLVHACLTRAKVLWLLMNLETKAIGFKEATSVLISKSSCMFLYPCDSYL